MPSASPILGRALSDVAAEVVRTQAPPGNLAIAAAALLAALLVLIPRVWRVARNVVTIAHEGSHGLAAILTGRRLTGIRVHSDTSGLAVSRGKPRGPGMILTVLAGYTGPALLGLLAAFLLGAGHALGVLWLAVVLLALLTVMMRNVYGLFAVLAAGAAVFAVTWWAEPQVQSLVAYAGAWFLLFAAPRPVLELQGRRRRGGSPNSDADVLARLTPLPGIVWVAFFFAVTVAAAVLGASQLLPGVV